MKLPLCVNFFGGPGQGKSTLAAGTFCSLKEAGVNCELITEFAKTQVWERSLKSLDDQVYILGQQSHRQFVCKDEVEVMITDSPILLQLYYGKQLGKSFTDLVKQVFSQYKNVNYLIERDDSIKYNPKGRTQTEDEAMDVHDEIKELLDYNGIKYKVLKRTKSSHLSREVADEVLKILLKGGKV